MPKAAEIPDPNSLFLEFTNREPALRRSYLEVGSRALAPDGETAPEQLLKSSAVLLELLAVTDCLFEALGEYQRQGPVADLKINPAIAERVRQLCGLELHRVVAESRKRLVAPPPAPDLKVEITIPLLVRATKSIIEACPIDELEEAAIEEGLEVWGHRCRVAHTALMAFVFRNDEQQPPRIRLLGRQYVSGGLTVPEIATILGLTSSDVLMLLDAYGFNRPLDTLALSGDQRDLLLTRISADRLHRRGREPAADPKLVTRDVLASQRIEGIDARQWIQRHEH